MKRLAAALLSGLALLVGGCGNLVHSDRALFTAADAREGPVFRRGLWIGDDPDCVFDEAIPRSEWPSCAEPWIMTSQGLVSIFEEDREMSLLVTGGAPAIIQIGSTAEPAGPYAYWALDVTRTDRRGRALAFSAWPVVCGPPPGPEPPAAIAEARRSPPMREITPTPFPGLEVRGRDCFTDSRTVVRDVARASQALTPEPINAHWVRDSER